MPIAIVMLTAVIAAILAARQEGDETPKSRIERARTIGYWIFTIVVVFEMTAGGIWDLLRIEIVRLALVRLGYPLYLLYILGPPKILCACALLAPRFPRLKEWAYAGAMFNYMGAAASHLLSGDRFGAWVAPLLFATLTLGSWALRPATRRLAGVASSKVMRPVAWLVPVLIVAAMAIVAFLNLPTSARQ
jgi:hypothetical protein